MFPLITGASLFSTRRLYWVAILLLQFAVLSLSRFPAVGQNTNFSFQSFRSVDQLTLLYDAINYGSDSSIYINAIGTSTQLGTCGKLLFKESVRLRDSSNSTAPAVASFSTFFTFAISGMDYWVNNYGYEHGDGFAFMFAVDNSTKGGGGRCMGMIDAQMDGNVANHLFAVEFDTFRNAESNDCSDNHVGVDVNSMTSKESYNLCGGQLVNCSYLVNGGDFTAWIDYDGANHTLEVRLANGSTSAGVKRPPKALIQVPKLDLSMVFNDYMYVGFSGSTGTFVEVHEIKSWSFVSSGMPDIAVYPSIPTPSPAPLPDSLRAKPTSKIALIRVVFAASTLLGLLGLGFCLFWCIRERRGRIQSHTEPVLEHYFLGPRQFTYKELSIATRNFNNEQLLGSGGFGQVYKGTLSDTGSVVAVKRITHESKQGEREFLAEISVISQIRHRNLVQLQGWCRDKDKLLLVYEYMPNSSLDGWLFVKQGQKKPSVLAWDLRHNILTGVAAALAYLHEEWEQCILHRDIKASNVMLDRDFHAHLGDFGLARLIDHDTIPKTTAIAGTLGYLAPEMPHTGKATKKSDVYSFGVLALEVACGRHVFDRSLSDSEMVLLDFVWRAYLNTSLDSVADPRLQSIFDGDQMISVLQLGLLCCHPDPDARPTMRFVHQCLIGEASLPALPASKPVVTYSLNPVGRVDCGESVHLELRVQADSDDTSERSFSGFPSVGSAQGSSEM